MKLTTVVFILMFVICSSSLAQERDGQGGRRSEPGRGDKVPGALKWKLPLGGNVGYCSPAIGRDGTIYTGAGRHRLYAVNPDGTEKWSVVTKGVVHAPPAIGEDGTIYVGSNDGKLYAIHRDGTEKWSFKTARRVDNGSAAIGKDGTIYVGSDDNHLYAVNPDGTEKWRFETGEVDDFDCSPAIGDDGTIYFGSKDGNLYALYDNSGGLAETPWPMHARDLRHTGRARSAAHISDESLDAAKAALHEHVNDPERRPLLPDADRPR